MVGDVIFLYISIFIIIDIFLIFDLYIIIGLFFIIDNQVIVFLLIALFGYSFHFLATAWPRLFWVCCCWNENDHRVSSTLFGTIHMCDVFFEFLCLLKSFSCPLPALLYPFHF